MVEAAVSKAASPTRSTNPLDASHGGIWRTSVIGGASGGAAGNDVEVDIDHGLRIPVAFYLSENRARCFGSNVTAIDTDRCQWRVCVGSKVKIAKTDDGEPIGYAATAAFASARAP